MDFKKLYETLEKENMYVDTIRNYGIPGVPLDPGVISICITWGDWKHDHLRLDNIMEGLGYTHITTNVTEEDGSDAYSATHYYCEAKDEEGL